MTNNIIIGIKRDLMHCSIFYIKSKYHLINKAHILTDQMGYKLLFRNKNSIHLTIKNKNNNTCNIIIFENNYIVFWNLNKYEIINIYNMLSIGLSENLKVHDDIYYEYQEEKNNNDKNNTYTIILDVNYENHQKNILSNFFIIKSILLAYEKKIENLSKISTKIAEVFAREDNFFKIDANLIKKFKGQTILEEKNLISLNEEILKYKELIYINRHNAIYISPALKVEQDCFLKERIEIIKDKIKFCIRSYKITNTFTSGNFLEIIITIVVSVDLIIHIIESSLFFDFMNNVFFISAIKNYKTIKEYFS